MSRWDNFTEVGAGAGDDWRIDSEDGVLTIEGEREWAVVSPGGARRLKVLLDRYLEQWTPCPECMLKPFPRVSAAAEVEVGPAWKPGLAWSKEWQEWYVAAKRFVDQGGPRPTKPTVDQYQVCARCSGTAEVRKADEEAP